MLSWSAGAPSDTSGRARVTLATGSDSPVSGASLTRMAGASRRRRSAVTMSPCSRSRTSPGTTSRAGTSRTSPSRTTRASGLDIRLRASMACSARYSWMKPTMPLKTTMARMIRVSLVSPMSAVMTAATRSTTIMALVNWSSSSRQAGRCFFSTSSLGPKRSRRSAAASAGSPVSARVSRAAATALDSSRQAWMVGVGSGRWRPCVPRMPRSR